MVCFAKQYKNQAKNLADIFKGGLRHIRELVRHCLTNSFTFITLFEKL